MGCNVLSLCGPASQHLKVCNPFPVQDFLFASMWYLFGIYNSDNIIHVFFLLLFYSFGSMWYLLGYSFSIAG